MFAAALALSLAACDGGNNDTQGSPKVTATAPSGQASGTLTPSEGATPSATTPGGRVSDEAVAFQTDDGVTVRGHVYSSPGPQRRAVILAHMFPNDQRAWQAFARELAGIGIAALTFDFRGYGETGGSKDVTKIDHDLSAALLFMKARDYPLIYLVGASMGGTAALKVAASQDVAGVVTVSAPVTFMGLSAQADVPRITERKLFLASRNEAEGGAQAAQQLMQLAPEPKDSFVFEGSAHGTALLEGPNAAAFKDKLIEFMQR